MKRLMLTLLALVLLGSAAAHAEPLAKPLSLAVSATAEARFVWQAVDQAAVYRVAVFDAADKEGKRPLLAAVWVKGLHWDYGSKAALVSVGKLPNTKPLPLPAGRTLRVMVAAARADGSDKSEWVGEDFSVTAAPQAVPVVVATAAPTAAPSPVALSGTAGDDAEIELVGGDEFKSSPEPTELQVEDGGGSAAAVAALTSGAGAGAAASAAKGSSAASDVSGVAAVSTTAGTDAAADLSVTAEAAADLLKAGKAEEAEAAYRSLLHGDGANADLWEGLGHALEARRMKAEALEAYSQALLLDGKRENLREWIRKNVPRR
jgi:hypothetical protein